MKKMLLLSLSVMAICCCTSCKKDTENPEEKWMIANREAFNAIKANPAYKEILSPGNEGSIYYKALKSGDGKEPIFFTSSVSCYYKGWFIADYPQYDIKSGDTFDQKLFDDGRAGVFSIVEDNLIAGWKTALQHMVRGDKWEIWVPYQLGYGRNNYPATGATKIPGFSTLVFELEITKIN